MLRGGRQDSASARGNRTRSMARLDGTAGARGNRTRTARSDVAAVARGNRTRQVSHHFAGFRRAASRTTSGALRAALVLHGKLGSLDRGQGWTRAVDGMAPNIDLAVISYASVVRHLVEANRDEYSIDVFGHSWSPEVGTVLDALFRPKESKHERETMAQNRELCASLLIKLRQFTVAHGMTPMMNFAAVGRGANSCERTVSHLLGMQRAIRLKASEASRS